MPDNAPYSGGFSPGATLFAVDGDWTDSQPDGPPSDFSFPFEGDTVFSNRDVIARLPGGDIVPFHFDRAALGAYPNLQPWMPNQSTLVFTQDFLVAAENYKPTPLNTPYNPDWANTWPAVMTNQRALRPISDCILVKESRPRDVVGGNLRVTRTYAQLPQTRNVLEEYVINFVGFADDTIATRPEQQRIVMSRVQFDYFVFDAIDILDWKLFNQNDGRRLNAATGIYPNGIIIPQQLYYNGEDENGYGQVTSLYEQDDTTDPPTAGSVPSLTDYLSWVDAPGVTGAEICAQASCFGPRPWMGNIWERRTRFVLAQ